MTGRKVPEPLAAGQAIQLSVESRPSVGTARMAGAPWLIIFGEGLFWGKIQPKGRPRAWTLTERDGGKGLTDET